MLVPSFRLDERAIMYGRTGKWPDDNSVGTEPKAKKPLTTPSNSLDLNAGGQRIDSKSPTYALLSGESLRSLSPAEQVRHCRKTFSVFSHCAIPIFLPLCKKYSVPFKYQLDRFHLRTKKYHKLVNMGLAGGTSATKRTTNRKGTSPSV